MKKICRCLYYIILMVICPVLLGSLEVHAGVNDFHFSDYTGDYYLSRDSEGLSHLKVVESFTAEFPDYPQNKGMCRQIPFTNQDGANVTLPDLSRSNLKLLRNGATEPIYSIEKENNYYNVCTGTEEYVLGTQKYTFEYEFINVVTDFDDYQELYWDTNGNGSMQKYDKVTARVHFVDEVSGDYTGQHWCYVGKYGTNGQGRCKTLEISDGVEFTADNLRAYENLTFDVELKAGAFVVPEPVRDYIYVWILAVLAAVCLIVISNKTWKFMKTREKARFYKGLFVKPEYQPHDKYSLPEMSEVYLGKKKDLKVAMMLELVVKRKISFQKKENKKWNIIVNDLNGVDEEYFDLLKILNGGNSVQAGDIIELKSRSANSRLIALRKAMEKAILSNLKLDGLVEKGYKYASSGSRGIANIIAMTVIILPTMIMIGVFVMGLLSQMLRLDESYGRVFVFYGQFYLTAFVMIAVTTIICVILSDAAQKYEDHTEEGLRASRYMDGLKLYIKMAEAERMKLLQSVKGADTSAEGIVKLYEKLLPYAAVFGLEESWMDEMREYCKVEEIEEPDYLMNNLAAYEISKGISRAASIASTSTVMSSSGGGSSSGFSGGGGGGFSGGGGGGGGASGR